MLVSLVDDDENKLRWTSRSYHDGLEQERYMRAMSALLHAPSSSPTIVDNTSDTHAFSSSRTMLVFLWMITVANILLLL